MSSTALELHTFYVKTCSVLAKYQKIYLNFRTIFLSKLTLISFLKLNNDMKNAQLELTYLNQLLLYLSLPSPNIKIANMISISNISYFFCKIKQLFFQKCNVYHDYYPFILKRLLSISYIKSKMIRYLSIFIFCCYILFPFLFK